MLNISILKKRMRIFWREDMRLIDHVIRKSLAEAVEGNGGLLAFSRRIGVAHSTVLFWLTGKTKSINSDLWRVRVYPEIESFLMKNLPDADLGCVREKYSDSLDCFDAEKRMLLVSVVRESDMMEYDAAMESVCSFAERFAMEKRLFVCDGRKKYFAVRMEHRETKFFFPSGTLLLCAADERVKSHDFALLRMRGGDSLRICRVFCKEESIMLESFSNGGEVAEWNYRKERGRVEWMFPALWMKVICSRMAK